MKTRLCFGLIALVVMTGCAKRPLDRIMVRGSWARDKGQSAWARRWMAAHTNAVENLVIFASLVLTARALGIATAATAFACALYFWSRLAHVVVYTLGIPVLRSLSFAAGFVAQVLLVLAIFKLI